MIRKLQTPANTRWSDPTQTSCFHAWYKVGSGVLKGRKVRVKVKTTTAFDKSSTAINKSESVINKSATVFYLFLTISTIS